MLSLRVPHSYPFRPPEVYCLTRCWHPNIDVETGRVRHPLLDRDWKPVLSLNTVIFGLQLFFIEPIADADFAANVLAAQTFAASAADFAEHVSQTLQGGFWFGFEFDANDAGLTARLSSGQSASAKKRLRSDDDDDDGDAGMALQDDESVVHGDGSGLPPLLDMEGVVRPLKHARCASPEPADLLQAAATGRPRHTYVGDARAMNNFDCAARPTPLYYLPPHNYPLAM